MAKTVAKPIYIKMHTGLTKIAKHSSQVDFLRNIENMQLPDSQYHSCFRTPFSKIFLSIGSYGPNEKKKKKKIANESKNLFKLFWYCWI